MRNEWEARFWEKVSVGELDECWPWAGRVGNTGYGQFSVTSSIQRSAHRISWELANGIGIPSGMIIRHKCDNRICCNPAHLELGTQADNVRDMQERGRAKYARGSASSNAKLTEIEVIEIKTLLREGVSQSEIGRRFGVLSSTISRIASGNSWGWINEERAGGMDAIAVMRRVSDDFRLHWNTHSMLYILNDYLGRGMSEKLKDFCIRLAKGECEDDDGLAGLTWPKEEGDE